MTKGTGQSGSETGTSPTLTTRASDRQTIQVTDVISEGPIYGLVNGISSVYLNDDSITGEDFSAVNHSAGPMTITLTNGSTSATINNSASANPIVIPSEGDGDKFLVIHNAFASSTVALLYKSRDTTTLTTSSSYFTADMITTSTDRQEIVGAVPGRLIGITGTSTTPAGVPIDGFLYQRDSGTVARWRTGAFGDYNDNPITDGSYTLELDRFVKLSSASGSSIVLDTAWTGATGNYKFDSAGVISLNIVDTVDRGYSQKYEGSHVQFRSGTLNQTPFSGTYNGGTAKVSSLGLTLERTTGFGGNQAPRSILGGSTASGNLGLSASQLLEVDEVKLNFLYPGGFYAVNGKGKDKTTYQQYKFEIAIKENGSFGPNITIQDPVQHSGLRKNATTFEHKIDLTKFRPFEDFKIIVSRKTAHDGPGYDSPTTTFPDWGNITQGSISTGVSIFKEKLNYPLTAMARTSFSTKEFQNMPKRGYFARGLLVNVPSNYVTREENGGAASYNRNITTGAIESTYQDWDGGFRSKLTYTNNPAWVFYDLLVNNRYGLGDFIQDIDIDKYSLYRIARYCDEEIDDGKGGTEPRYTLNAYFTKATDAYKVLKDVSTTFLGMLYFLDGKILAVQDAPSSPVYSFSKANVIDGAFSYEGTGSKTRVNQVVVSWNNPDNNYNIEPLLVEDKINIAETGRIITQDAFAFGCSSEGQALRYGRWKLWTAANQREVVSFATSINGSFIGPGDIINVQDADRHAVRYSGRISNTGTLSTTVIPLDAPVTLAAGYTYNLSVIVVEPGAFLQKNATVNGIAKVEGDLIQQAFVGGSLVDIDTEAKASNARGAANSADALHLSWKDNVRVETQPVTVSVGSTSSLTVSTAFSTAPAREDIWVLTQLSSGQTVDGSAKEYKVLGISQSAKNTYDITAAEHFDVKYSAVEEDFTTFVAESLAQPLKATDIVPKPTDLFFVSDLTDDGSAGDDIIIRWSAPIDPPKTVQNEDGTTSTVTIYEEYEFLHGFEIAHNFPGIESPIRVEKGVREYKVANLPTGLHKASLRTVNTLENKSQPVIISVEISDRFRDNLNRFPEGLPYGGLASTNTQIGGNTGIFEFGDNVFGFKAPQSGAAIVENSSSSATTYKQDCTGIASISWTGQTVSGEFIHEHHYLAIDSSDQTDRIKLLKYYKSPSHQVPYWYNAVDGSNTTGTVALTGTVSKVANSSKVTGSGTSFVSALAVGELFLVGSSAAKIARIESNTVLFLDRSLSTFYSNVSASTNNFHFDYQNDCIIGRVYKDNSNVFHLQTFLGLDATLAPQRAISRSIYRLNSNSINTSSGTFSSPLDNNSGWSLSVPSLTTTGDIVYVANRTFTNNGASPQDAAWSTPTVYATKIDGAAGAAGATGPTGPTGAAGAAGAAGDSVVPIYASDSSGSSQSFTQQTREYINYYEYNTTTPTLPLSGLTWVKFSGDGVVAIFASDVNGSNQSFTQGSLPYVNYYEYSGNKPNLPVSGLTWVKYIGADGGSVNFAFKRSTGAPGAPTDTSEPVGYPSNGWYDDASQATGAGVLYAIKGTLSGTTWTWGTAYALDGEVAQELYVYNLNVQTPTNNGSYKFADTSSAAVWTTPTGGWTKSPPSLASDGDIVYVSAAVVTGNPGSTVAPSWSTGVVYSRREDGEDGADAFNAVLGWTSRVVPRDSSGNPDLTGTGNTVTLYRGGALYGTFNVSTSATNITAAAPGSGNPLSYGVATNWGNTSTDLATIVYTVTPVVGGVNQASIILTSTFTLAPAGAIGNTGFLFVTSLPTASNYEEGQVVIVEASAGAAQQGYIKSGAQGGGSWTARDIVNHEIIFADAIRAEQLEISSTTAGGSSIFMNSAGTNNSIEIYDNNTLRVKIGKL